MSKQQQAEQNYKRNLEKAVAKIIAQSWAEMANSSSHMYHLVQFKAA